MEKSIKQLYEDLGIVTKKNAGTDKVLCPKCSHTRKKKTDPCLNLNFNDGSYFCHNQGCEFSGYVKTNTNYEPPVKNYIKPIYNNNTSISDAIVKWFFSRGISQDTLKKSKITEGRYKTTEKEVATINFNYFRNDELINVKYRWYPKEFRLTKDAELIFYGLNNIKESDWCVIVEGEIDQLSFVEAGINEVISVPNGAAKGKSSLEYLDNCIDYFENKTKIIIATDNDGPGITLRDELARRLGYERCYKVNMGTFKDANELLLSKGKESLVELIKPSNLIDFPISGVITANSIWDEVEVVMEKGLERGATTRALKEFDEMVSFMPGQLMVLTGIPNHGKSPFALMVMCSLSVHHGYKWALFTPEHRPLAIFLITICECLMGKRVRKGIKFSDREKNLAKEFINNHFYFIQPEDDDVTLKNILAKATSLVVKYGINGMLIDPWNKLEHNIEKGETETTYISKELDKIIKFDQRHGVLSIVIAHPTKIRKDNTTKLFEVPNLYDISGSSNWYNKPDIGITFYRNFKTNLSEIHVQKMKYNHLGSQGACQVKYNYNNSRFSNENGDYDNTNWLLPRPEQPSLNFAESKKEQELTADTTQPEMF